MQWLCRPPPKRKERWLIVHARQVHHMHARQGLSPPMGTHTKLLWNYRDVNPNGWIGRLHLIPARVNGPLAPPHECAPESPAPRWATSIVLPSAVRPPNGYHSKNLIHALFEAGMSLPGAARDRERKKRAF
jgi:hypothetical protein